MGSLRFALMVLFAFAAAFAGMSWASHGFRMPMLAVVPLEPDPRIPTFEQSVAEGRQRDWMSAHTAQSDGDPERDALRLVALQAANAYGLSPCDGTMKANLTAALTAYAKAWADMAGCKGMRCDDDKKLDAAAAAFRSPADMRLREAAGKAFAQGGISLAEFDPALRSFVGSFAGRPGNATSACASGAPPQQHQWRPLPITAQSNPSPRPPPPRRSAVAGSDQPWANNERYVVHTREIARKGVVDVFSRSWGSLCAGPGRARMLGALAYYFGQRANQMRSYRATWGDAGGRFIASAWATPEDAHVERLTREMYGRGYFKPADVSGRARAALTEAVRGERVTGNPCRG